MTGGSLAAFGSVIGAGLFGVAIGALFVGPISDRKGRKSVRLDGAVRCRYLRGIVR